MPVLRQLEKQGTRSGSQKFECKRSPRPNQNLEDKMRQKAVQMPVEGLSQRRVARMLQ